MSIDVIAVLQFGQDFFDGAASQGGQAWNAMYLLLTALVGAVGLLTGSNSATLGGFTGLTLFDAMVSMIVSGVNRTRGLVHMSRDDIVASVVADWIVLMFVSAMGSSENLWSKLAAWAVFVGYLFYVAEQRGVRI